MSLKINEVLILFIIIQLFLFFLYLFFRRGINKSSNRILGIFFLSLSINFFHLLISKIYGSLPKEFIHFSYVGAPFAFLYAPVFYFYTRSLTKHPFKSNLNRIYHFIPFIAFTIYLSVIYYFRSADEKIVLIKSSKVIPGYLYHAVLISLQLQVLLYFIAGVMRVRKFRKRIKNYYSSIDKVQYNWISHFIFILLCLYLVDVARYLSHFINKTFMLISEITLISGFIVLCYWVIYKAVTNPVVLLTEHPAQKSAKNISPALKNKYADKLLKYMISEKPYLRPELTLNELADLVAIPSRTLSDILNKVLNKTFYDFINGYRIKEAQNRIENSYNKETILEILYEVGFNSKSSFNTMFKKNTGLTPTQYRTKIFHEN